MLFPLLLAETVHLWAKRHINLDVKPPLEMLSGFPITIELSRERGQGETWRNHPKSVFVVEQKRQQEVNQIDQEKRLVSKDNRF